MKFHSSATLIPPPENTAEIDAAVEVLAQNFQLFLGPNGKQLTANKIPGGYIVEKDKTHGVLVSAAQCLVDDFHRRIAGHLTPSFIALTIRPPTFSVEGVMDHPHSDSKPFAACAYSGRSFILYEGDFEIAEPVLDAHRADYSHTQLFRFDSQLRESTHRGMRSGIIRKTPVDNKTVAICEPTTIHARGKGDETTNVCRIFARTPF